MLFHSGQIDRFWLFEVIRFQENKLVAILTYNLYGVQRINHQEKSKSFITTRYVKKKIWLF